MFDTIDGWEQHLTQATALIARVTASMLPTIRALDVAQVDLVDGSRTMIEWLASRLDIETTTARTMLNLAWAADTELEASLGEGTVSFDRAAAVVRLKASGASEADIDHSFGMDLQSVRRFCASHTTITASDETQLHAQRFLHLQPTLDESSYRLWGLLTGIDGRVVEKALDTQTQSFPNHPGITGAQARADALTSICDEWLTGDQSEHSTVSAEIFVNAGLAADGERGAAIAGGNRVGPNTLSELLCGARIGVTVLDDRFNPIATSNRRGAIPPSVRRAVLYRDGEVCAIDGCTSRRRLQPHHVQPQASGVNHHADNLTTLCWYHHHVVIHQMGYKLDPTSRPQRRRFIRPRAGPG